MACKRREQRKRAKARKRLLEDIKNLMQNIPQQAQEMTYNWSTGQPISYATQPVTTSVGAGWTISAADCGPIAYRNPMPILLDTLSCQTKEKEKENTMSVSPMTPEKSYLIDRLRGVYYDKVDGLPKLFGLRDDPSPVTPKELVDRIAAGKFILGDDAEENDYDCPMYRIRWRDPAVKEDKDGYQKARAAAEKAQTTAKDTIMLKDNEAGLAALQAFESATFQ